MSITPEAVGGSLGTGLGAATIWFPITYFALRKPLQLIDDLGHAWKPYILCIVLFAIMDLLGVSHTSNSTIGMIEYLLIAISACGVVLYFTYRKT